MISLNTSSKNIPQHFTVLRQARSLCLLHNHFAGCSPRARAARRGSVCLRLENYKYVNQLLKFPFALDPSQDTKLSTASQAWTMVGDFSNPRPTGRFPGDSPRTGRPVKASLATVWLLHLFICLNVSWPLTTFPICTQWRNRLKELRSSLFWFCFFFKHLL